MSKPNRPTAHREKRVVYDLTPTMRIRLSDGTQVSLAELERLVESGMTCFAYAPWSTSENPRSTRIIASRSSDGLALFDFKTRTSHRWAARKPQVNFDELAVQLKAALAAAHGKRRT
jgi:hypothetical protein